jgi:hypothetical protein
MRSKVEEYRRKAAEADQQADQAKDAQAVQTYRKAAAYWRELAEKAERDNH